MKTILILLPFLLLGCATGHLTETAFSKLPADTKNAQIYIYRPPIDSNSVNPDIPLFFINDKKVGPLQMSGYYAETVSPGPIEVYMTYNGLFGTSIFEVKKNIKFDAQAGQTYFVRLDGADFLQTGYILKMASNVIGLLEIRTMRLMSPTLIK